MRRGVIPLHAIDASTSQSGDLHLPNESAESRYGTTADQLTEWMAAAQLRLLRILPVELRPDRV